MGWELDFLVFICDSDVYCFNSGLQQQGIEMYVKHILFGIHVQAVSSFLNETRLDKVSKIEWFEIGMMVRSLYWNATQKTWRYSILNFIILSIKTIFSLPSIPIFSANFDTLAWQIYLLYFNIISVFFPVREIC